MPPVEQLAVLGIAIATLTAVTLLLRRFMGTPRPPIDQQDVRFRESFVSVASDRNLFGLAARTRNSHSVIVMKNELVIEPSGPFKWLGPGGFADLDHRVPRADVSNIEPAKRWFRDVVRLQIRGADGETRTLELAVRKPREFMAAMRA